MTSSEPLLSIVIDNYNYGRFLEQAVESALAQSYDNVEVIVVDDGSSDNSAEIIASYGTRVVGIAKANGGQASAVNAGFAASRGDVVLVLDADDFLKPEAGASVMGCFRERPDLSKVHFRLTVVDESARSTGAVLPPRRLRLPRGDMRDTLANCRTYVMPPMSGNAYRRSAIERQMPMPEQIYPKDADEWLSFTAPILGPIEAIDEELGCYRMHSANLSSRNRLSDGETFAAHVEEGACVRRKQADLFRDLLGTRIDAIAPRDLSHIRQLLILRKIYPAQCRYGWSTLTLLLRGIRAAFLANEVSAMHRPFWALWFLGVALLPRRTAFSIVVPTLDARRRPLLLRRLLGQRG